MPQKIDRDKLNEALKNVANIHWRTTHKLFNWSGRMDDSVVKDIAGLSVSGLGIVSWPLDNEKLINLRDAFGHGNVTNHENGISKSCCQIDSSQLSLIPRGGQSTQQLLHNLMCNVLEKMLNVSFDNLNVNIEAKLEKIVICTESESYQESFNSCYQIGKFGTIFLQVPVAGNSQCGSLVFEDGTEVINAQFESDNSCSAVAVAGHSSVDRKGNFLIHSGAGEWTVVLVINLIWHDSEDLPPSYFPRLLICLNEIKDLLMLWQTNGVEASGTEESKFLCWSSYFLDECSSSDRNDCGQRVARNLMCITFLDAHEAIVQLKGNVKVPENRDPYMWIPPMEFKTGLHSNCTIRDEIFKSAIGEENLICGISYWKFKESDSNIAVLVLRPRNLDVSLIFEDSVKIVNKSHFLLCSIEERIKKSGSKVLEHSMLRERLLQELEQVLSSLVHQGVSNEVCSQTFFPRYFAVIAQLKANEIALKTITDLLEHPNASDWLVCKCYNHRSTDLPSAFANFICLANGWEKCPDILNSVILKLDDSDHCKQLADIALNLLHNGCMLGAMETFKVILKTAQECLSNEDWRLGEIFDSQLLVLAIRLQELEPNSEVLNNVLDLTEHLYPERLTKLLKTCGNLLTTKSLNCSTVLERLGQMISPPRIFQFSTRNLIDVLEVYHSLGDWAMMESIWEGLCSRCIEIFNSGDTATVCEFCCLLMEENRTGQVRKEFMTGLSNVANFKEAIGCSLKMLNTQLELCADTHYYVNHMEYINYILLLAKDAQLCADEVLGHLSAFCSRKLYDVFQLSIHIAVCKFEQVRGESSMMRRVLEMLLKHVSTHDASEILTAADREDVDDEDEDNVSEALVPFAILGDVNLVKIVAGKFDERIGASEMDHRKKNLAVFAALEKMYIWNLVPSEVFTYLMLEYLKTLESLSNRAIEVVKCFKLLASIERERGNLKEETVLSQFKVLADRLTFQEAIRIVTKIFNTEFKVEEKAHLKQLPICWEIFAHFCSIAVENWDLDIVSAKVSRNRIISLMQSVLWIGEEKNISKLCLLVKEIPPSVAALADIVTAIIRHQWTVELASGSQLGFVGFENLISTRVRALKRSLSVVVGNDPRDITVAKKEKAEELSEQD